MKVAWNRIGRFIAVGSASLIPVTGISILPSTGVAAGSHPTGFSCTAMKGTVNAATSVAKIKLLDCFGNNGGKGKSKGPFAVTGSNTTTFKWANGDETTANETTNSGSGSGCAPGDIEQVVGGVVTADTTKSTKKGAAVSGVVCYDQATGELSLYPGSGFSFGA